jgi:hypothetical protein
VGRRPLAEDVDDDLILPEILGPDQAVARIVTGLPARTAEFGFKLSRDLVGLASSAKYASARARFGERARTAARTTGSG